MTYFPNRDRALAVANGDIANERNFHKYGRNGDVDAATPADIWAYGPTQPIWLQPTEARIHNIVSTDTNDGYAGTGARTLLVQGLDALYLEISEIISMNGTTIVPTVNSYIFIDTIGVSTAGSAASNLGLITATATTDATVSAAILIGAGRTQLSMFQVPDGYNAYIIGVHLGFQHNTAGSSCDISVLIKNFGGVFQIYDNYSLLAQGTSAIDYEYRVPLRLSAKSVIKFRAVASANNSDITCGVNYHLIKI